MLMNVAIAKFLAIRAPANTEEFRIITAISARMNTNPNNYAISTEICFALIVWLSSLEK